MERISTSDHGSNLTNEKVLQTTELIRIFTSMEFPLTIHAKQTLREEFGNGFTMYAKDVFSLTWINHYRMITQDRPPFYVKSPNRDRNQPKIPPNVKGYLYKSIRNQVFDFHRKFLKSTINDRKNASWLQNHYYKQMVQSILNPLDDYYTLIRFIEDQIPMTDEEDFLFDQISSFIPAKEIAESYYSRYGKTIKVEAIRQRKRRFLEKLQKIDKIEFIEWYRKQHALDT